MSKIPLNKEICKKCHIKKFGDWGDTTFHNDDEYWEEGIVFCGMGQDNTRIQHEERTMIRNGVPPYCHYKLEHILMSKK